MSKKRNIKISTDMNGDLENIYRVANASMDDTKNQIIRQLTILRQEYWDLVKNQVTKLKEQRNLTVQQATDNEFLISTFIQYTPVVRTTRSKPSIVWQKSTKMLNLSTSKKQITGEHIKMNEPQSNLMPGYYSETKFPLPPAASWQLEYIMRVERKFHMLRILIHKMLIPHREVCAVVEAFDKIIDNKQEISDPSHAPMINEDSGKELMQLRNALQHNDEDVNALTPELGKLLMATPSSELRKYGIDPDLKNMYF